MKKVVVKLDLHDAKAKKKAMNTVSGLSGIESISMDMKENKLTVVGDVDPVEVVKKLRKLWHTEVLSVGPKEAEKKKDPNEQNIADVVKPYNAYNPCMTQRYYVYSAEENPNACVLL